MGIEKANKSKNRRAFLKWKKGKKLEAIRTANVQKAAAPKKPEQKPEPLPLSQTLAEFVKKNRINASWIC